MEEESCNVRDDMVIDGHELVQQQVNTILKGFNPDHLKVYKCKKTCICTSFLFFAGLLYEINKLSGMMLAKSESKTKRHSV
ncbi:hypothetical protein QJS10_CPA03g00933 [Acorus calamus]|uniref:Uncharacterized protein n=1 Tax=Acorus calamus TaxID=4465 RepID=A0AAV9F345_ACOCL|nr:hypothetical protein QJS10_CPA03g00933 [Acorus calamus]